MMTYLDINEMKMKAVRIALALSSLHLLATLSMKSTIRGTSAFPGFPALANGLALATQDAIGVMGNGDEYVYPHRVGLAQVMAADRETRLEVLFLLNTDRGVNQYAMKSFEDNYDNAVEVLEQLRGKLDEDGNPVFDRSHIDSEQEADLKMAMADAAIV